MYNFLFFKTIVSLSIVKKKSWVKTWRSVTSPPWPLQHVLGRLPTSVSSTCLNSLDRFKIIVLFMRINYLLIILCSSVSYICFNTSTAWTGCNSSNPVRKSSSTSNHHCPGVPSLWPWQGVPPGLDGLDRGAQPHRHLGHLRLLGLVLILFTFAVKGTSIYRKSLELINLRTSLIAP